MLKQIAGLWAWLFVMYAVDPAGGADDPDPDDPDNPAGEDDPDDPDNPDPDARREEGDAGAEGDSSAANIKNLRKERQQERDARIAAEARLAALEQQNRDLAARVQGGGRTQEEVIPADETPEQRFVRVGNKVLNENKERVNQATLIAVDAADKVEFYSMAAENPLVNKWKPKVEAELARMRREENNRAPRVLIMRYLIGKAAEEAAIEKAKTPGRKTKAEEDAEGRTREARRGAGPLPKSDVRGGSGAKSERQKREERLNKPDATF
jgi:hypothetical protein